MYVCACIYMTMYMCVYMYTYVVLNVIIVCCCGWCIDDVSQTCTMYVSFDQLQMHMMCATPCTYTCTFELFVCTFTMYIVYTCMCAIQSSGNSFFISYSLRTVMPCHETYRASYTCTCISHEILVPGELMIQGN